jgi:hypothetical protein
LLRRARISSTVKPGSLLAGKGFQRLARLQAVPVYRVAKWLNPRRQFSQFGGA